MNRAMKVLCLDIEGGHGGSSRSLAVALRHLDRTVIEPTVWMRRESWLIADYARLRIAAEVYPDMPKTSALPRFSRNLVMFSQFFGRLWPQSAGFRRRLLAVADQVNLVHFNHEATFWLARWLRRQRPDLPMTMHIRTNLHRGLFARWQCRVIARAVDAAVFITENERQTFAGHAPLPLNYNVIYNPVVIPDDRPPVHSDIPADDRVKIGALANYSPGRGLDRLVDIASAMPAGERAGLLFVVAGDMGDGALITMAETAGVADSFLFLGHVDAPETVLSGLDLLIKPTREANPWGRDILEAMAASVPVVSYGRFQTFVENGETGCLFEDFDARETASALLTLARDPERMARLGKQARARVRVLCDPAKQAAALADFWVETAVRRKAEQVMA